MTAFDAPDHGRSAGRISERAHSGRWARIATERALATGAIAVVALHVVDDNFLQPQPGTSAGDHLAGGLVQLAVLGLGVAMFRRVRPGARAALALAFGVFGLILATEAAYYSATVGPSGDDYTGLLAVPAGLLLLGLASRTLWKTRRLDDSRWWRYPRRALLAAAGIGIVGQFVMFPIAVANFATHVHRSDVPAANLGTAYQDVSFETSDGLRLEGWYVPSKNGAAVIAFPGRNGPQKHARVLARHGYGVLLFDRRGEGASEGDGNVFGWGGEKDILAAIEFLKSRPDVQPGRIGGIGFSVGGEMMLQAAAETDELAAVVSEGAGTRWLAEDMQDAHGTDNLLAFPTYAVQTAAIAVFASTAPPPKLTDLVRRIHQPLFLIWAPNGGNIETMNPVYYRLAPGPKQIWAIPDAKHIGGITAHPKEYEQRVVGFFDRALLDPRSQP